MNDRLLSAVVTVFIGIIGVAALAVLVSRQSNTTGVIGAGSSGFANALCAALSPIGVNCGQRQLIPQVDSSIIFQ